MFPRSKEPLKKRLFALIASPLFWVLTISGTVRAIYYSVLLTTSAVDTASYINYHANILLGQTDKLRTPLYPYFIKLIGSFAQADLINAVVVVQIVISFLTLILFYKISIQVFNNKWMASAASLIYGIMLPVINFDKLILTESLSVSCVIMLLYLITAYLGTPGKAKAWLPTLFIFACIMLRPSFIYLLPVIIFLWLFQFIIVRKNRPALYGLVASAVVILLIAGYSFLNKINSGFNGVSVVSNNNELAVVVDAGIYMNGGDPEISAAIMHNINLAKNHHGNHVQGINIMKRFDDEHIHSFIFNCIKNKPWAYTRFIFNKFSGLKNNNIFTNYAAHKLTGLAFKINDIEYSVFHVPFKVIYLVMAISLAFILLSLIKYKVIPWFNILLWLLITGQIIVAFVGGYSEYQRLILPAIPMLVLLVFSCISNFNAFISKRVALTGTFSPVK